VSTKRSAHPSHKQTDLTVNMMLNSAIVLLLSIGAEAFVPSPQGNRFALSPLNAKKKIFIDGEAGTTGLQVRGRIEARDDLEIISPPNDLRKDEATRKKFINEADAVILCKRIFAFALYIVVKKDALGYDMRMLTL
jgi:hypothetical protein